VCRRYFLEHDPSKIDEDGNVEERYCKLDAIQGDLSVLRGWVFSWLLLVGTLVTIPYGIIADSVGRKVVVAASLISVTLPKAWIIVVCKSREQDSAA
jgi:MFS family permease